MLRNLLFKSRMDDGLGNQGLYRADRKSDYVVPITRQAVLPTGPRDVGESSEEEIAGETCPTDAGDCRLNEEHRSPNQTDRNHQRGPGVHEYPLRTNSEGERRGGGKAVSNRPNRLMQEARWSGGIPQGYAQTDSHDKLSNPESENRHVSRSVVP